MSITHCPYCDKAIAVLLLVTDEPNDHALVFGELTKAGHGGMALDGISPGATIEAGDEAGHWQINDDGIITPSPAGEGHLVGPYELTVAERQVTITIESATYDAATIEELLAVLPQNAPPASISGKTIMLRPGQFGDPDSPTLTLLQKVCADPANPLTITSREPHTLWVDETEIVRDLGNPGILPKMRILRCSGIVFKGIGWHHNFYPGAKTSENMVLLSLELDGIVFDGCNMYCQEGLEGSDQNINVIGADGNANETTRNVIIRNCAIHDARSLLNAVTPGMIVEGNYLYNAHVDFCHISSLSSGCRIKWNVFYRGTVPGSGFHPDFLQSIVAGQNADLNDVEIDGNRWFSGEICQVIQGVFLDNFHPDGTGRHKNVKVRGNLIVGLGIRGISIGDPIETIENIEITNNTVVRDKRMPVECTVGIFTEATCINVTIRNNVAESVQNEKDGCTVENNVELGEDGELIPYQGAFAGSGDYDFAPNNVADLMAAYAMQPGGPLDLPVKVGAVGSGYVDWKNRALNQ